MSDVKVVNEFEKMGLPEVREAISTMAKEVKGVFEGHRNEEGQVALEAIGGEDAKRVAELSVKLAAARERYEHLQELAGHAETAEKLSAYMNAPVTMFPQAPAQRDAADVKTLGQRVFKSLQDKPREPESTWTHEQEQVARISKGMKAVLGTDAALADVGVEYPPESVRVGTVVETLYQPHNVAPLIPQLPYSQNAIPYMVETVNSEGAAETAEGALGNEASIQWAEAVEPIRKITVLQPVTEELLADEGTMRAIIDMRLRQFMGNREDLQILKGDGIAPNLEGILNRTGVQNVNYSLTGADAQGLAEAALDAAGLVMTGFQAPSAYLMRIATWLYIAKAKGSDNEYLFPNALQSGVTPRLWGLPVTTNENMDNYTAATDVPILTGDFGTAATIFRRQGVTVQVSDSHTDRFARGVLTIRLLERLGLVVWRPSGFATVTRTA